MGLTLFEQAVAKELKDHYEAVEKDYLRIVSGAKAPKRRKRFLINRIKRFFAKIK